MEALSYRPAYKYTHNGSIGIGREWRLLATARPPSTRTSPSSALAGTGGSKLPPGHKYSALFTASTLHIVIDMGHTGGFGYRGPGQPALCNSRLPRAQWGILPSLPRILSHLRREFFDYIEKGHSDMT